MRKLTLNLEQLSVDSFDTTAVEKAKGTVVGEQCTCWTRCGQNTCPGCPTCDNTCAYTCDDATCPACPTCAASCNGTCDCPTAGVSCYNTDCGCNPGTCYDTACGNYMCCI
jgi:hypothetical protein